MEKPSRKGLPNGAEKRIKCTPELTEALCKAVRLGHYPSVAIERLGASRECLKVWMKRGAKGEEPYATFRQKLIEAKCDDEGAAIVAWRRAMAGDPANGLPPDAQAAERYLAKKYPKRWGYMREREIEMRVEQKMKYEAQDREAKAAAERGGGSESTEIIITTRGAPATVSVTEKPKPE